MLSNALGTPAAAGLDGAGNLFVLDQSGGSVVELTVASGYTLQTTLPAKAYLSQSIAVNSNGDLFISSTASSTVNEVLASSGYSSVRTIATPAVPNGIALDAFGNLFVAENATRTVVKYDYADPPSLTFNPTPAGTTSADSPQTVTLINNGNTNLVFTQPNTGINPVITPGFTLGAGTCPQLTNPKVAYPTLAADTSCTYLVSFSPSTSYPVSGSLTTSDNNLNASAATQVIPLNGTGTAVAAPITFTVPNHNVGDPPFIVAATSASPGCCTYTVLSGPATVALNMVTLTGPGIVTLQATEPTIFTSASVAYAAGTASTSFNVIAPQVALPQTITFPALATPAYAETSVTLNAYSTSGLPITYAVVSGPGSITGTTLTYTGLGTVTVQASQSGGSTLHPGDPRHHRRHHAATHRNPDHAQRPGPHRHPLHRVGHHRQHRHHHAGRTLARLLLR